MSDILRVRLLVFGTVQGVGFRPFVDRLARRYSLGGFIRNTARGVTIELEGGAQAIEAFCSALTAEAPPLSLIERIERTKLSPAGQRDFVIEQSAPGETIEASIPPDTATCDACVRELFDKQNRRYRHPFINCTDCGPRFSIIRGIPYDRKKTAMAEFPMCGECAAEFFDISTRRYHAQPVCCNDCGPRLWLSDNAGDPIPGDAIRLCQKALEAGQIAAIKGIGGFHLACIVTEDVVRRLRARKRREQKPLAILCRDLAAAKRFCHIDETAEHLLTGFRRPIVLCPKIDADAYGHLSENGDLGLLLPYAPIHHLLFDGADFDALVMTSANPAALPITRENGEALSSLRDIADVFLLHDRQIDNRCDDSLVYPLNGKEYFVRRSRGYVPQPVFVPDFKTPVLACGAQQKASFCLAANGRAYLSAHIGDLESIETFEHYTSQVRHFERLFEIAPAAVACDLHPDYLSTRFAEECAKQTGAPLFRVQHHRAHMAACMADNELSGDVIGVVFDGTGLGEDGTIWGGEFLFGTYQSVRRMGHLSPFPLSGGDAAARDPVRAAFGALYAAGIDPCEIFPKRRELLPPLAANVNCPATTSAGRLFDAMAALCGITEKNAYEARSAMLLQSLAQRAGECPADAPWDVRLIDTADGFLLDTLAFLTYAAHDKRAGRDPRFTAEAFHRALAAGVLAACRRIRSATQCSRVVLSGGVFLNLHLLSLVQKALEADGFAVFCHRRVSCCDEGLSLGQAAVAQALLSAR